MTEQPIADFQKIRLAIDKGRGGEALEAKHGQFSEQFFRTTTAALRLAPAVTEHVLSLITASGGAEDRVDGTREAPLPMSVQAFADVNEIYSLLVYWTRVFATELHVQAPGPAMRAWRNQAGTITGLPASVTASQGRYMVGVMSTWLTVHLEAICALDPDDVIAFQTGTDDASGDPLKMDGGLRTIFAVDARWPQNPKPRYSDMPCPDSKCGGRIAVYPPRSFGDDERIVCAGCGRHFLPEQYEHLITVFKQIRAEKATGDKVVAHIMRTYGSQVGGSR